MNRSLAIGVLAFGTLAAHVKAQDSTAQWRGQSLVGSAGVAFNASYAKPYNYSYLAGSAGFAPFVNERWQLGIEPAFQIVSASGDYNFSGLAAVTVNYL